MNLFSLFQWIWKCISAKANEKHGWNCMRIACLDDSLRDFIHNLWLNIYSFVTTFDRDNFVVVLYLILFLSKHLPGIDVLYNARAIYFIIQWIGQVVLITNIMSCKCISIRIYFRKVYRTFTINLYSWFCFHCLLQMEILRISVVIKCRNLVKKYMKCIARFVDILVEIKKIK